MNINDLTPTELENCAIIASRESFESGRKVTIQDIILRETTLAKLGFSNVIEWKNKFGYVKTNVGSTFFIEYADGKVSKIKLVKEFDASNADENFASLESKVGQFLDTANEGDVFKNNHIEFIIVRIQEPNPTEEQATI
jgi:hypothetical protein